MVVRTQRVKVRASRRVLKVKGEEGQKAKAGDASKSDNKPKAKSDPKATNKPQCFKWVDDAGSGGGWYDETAEPKGKGKGKAKGKAIAKVQASSSSSSAGPPSNLTMPRSFCSPTLSSRRVDEPASLGRSSGLPASFDAARTVLRSLWLLRIAPTHDCLPSCRLFSLLACREGPTCSCFPLWSALCRKRMPSLAIALHCSAIASSNSNGLYWGYIGVVEKNMETTIGIGQIGVLILPVFDSYTFAAVLREFLSVIPPKTSSLIPRYMWGPQDTLL